MNCDLLYTSHQGGTISLDLNGMRLSGALKIGSTFNTAEPLAWRQWHHWNLMKNVARLKLPKGVSVLTVRILTEGNMNLAYLNNYIYHPGSPGLMDNKTWNAADPTDACKVDGLYGNYGRTWGRKFPGYTVTELQTQGLRSDRRHGTHPDSQRH